MLKFSFTTVISIAFMCYICHSIWTLSKLFVTPSCNENESCILYYLHDNPSLQMAFFTSTKKVPSSISEVTLIDVIKKFDYDESFERELMINIPSDTRYNGTMYMHVFVLPRKYNVATWHDVAKGEVADHSVYSRTALTQYQLPSSGTYQLLTGQNPGRSLKPVTHLKSHITYNMLTGVDSLSRHAIPGELMNYLKFSSRNTFLPIIYPNYVHDRLRNLVEVNQNTNEMNVTFHYEPISLGKLRLLIQIETSFVSLKSFGFNDKDLDEVKGIFADTHFYLLCATIFISSVHLLFDFLAFKNDISFWRSRQSMAGLSGRTVMWRCFSQVVIFLYLLDEDTSLLVLGPAGIATLIEFWKVQKIVPIDWKGMKLKTVPLNEAEKKTREFDAESMRYLSYILYPLCIGSAVYSLVQETHRSWYSWCIHSLVNGVYAFGFLFMLPQLFINYRLKSVAHLPWRSFMYKAFNTFIDDIFAFIITMPTAHRIACFRDDIVFLIYLYQRWLYPVDKSRIDDSTQVDQNIPEMKKKM